MPTTNILNVNTSGLVTYDGAGVFSATNYTNTTFTPTLLFGAGSVGLTYTTQVGFYTRIGNIVYISVNIQLSSKGSSTGFANFTGLPFTSSSTDAQYSLNAYYLGMASFPGSTTDPVARIALSDTKFTIWGYLGPSVGTISQLGDSNFTNTSLIRVDGFYRV